MFGCLVATFALPLVAIKGGDGHEEPNKSTKKTKNGGGDKAAASGDKQAAGKPRPAGGKRRRCSAEEDSRPNAGRKKPLYESVGE